jgi:thymidylate kinase
MKIVLTGGPCAGKTTIAEILVKTFSERLTIVPEAASLLFSGGFPRNSGIPGARCQQRAIYHVQRELEAISALQAPAADLICDRGSLDGAAYWPGEAAEFLAEVESTLESEIRRYDWVLHLDTAGTKEYRRTAVRVEDFDKAAAVNERVKQVWQAHPRQVIVPHDDDFSRKIIKCLEITSMILRGNSIEQVRAVLR